MHVCVHRVEAIRSATGSTGRPGRGKDGRMFVVFLCFCAASPGRRMHACRLMRVRVCGELPSRCMCSVGTADVGVARFQSLDGDGGGTLPRGIHMVRELWIGDEAWRLDGELKEGVWAGRDGSGREVSL
jgi:hypothetical protein